MTPSDLCNYIIDMQSAYKGKPSKVLSPEMVKLHLSPYNNGPTGMGTFIDDLDGAKYFLHSAGNDGFCGFYFASLEDGYGLVVFLNSEDAGLLPEILSCVAKTYSWKNLYREPQRKYTEKSVAVPDSVLKTYEGIYVYEQSWAAVEKKGSEYYFYANGMHVKMHYTTPTRFYNEEFSAVKEFFKDEKGNIAGYTRTVDGKEYPKALKITNLDTLRLESGRFLDICRYLLDNKKYAECLAYYKRAAQLYPDDLTMQMNMAHVHVFNRDYENAMAIYKAHLKDTISPGNSWENQMQNDLAYFAEHYHDVEPFDKIFAALKIQKPKGY